MANSPFDWREDDILQLPSGENDTFERKGSMKLDLIIGANEDELKDELEESSYEAARQFVAECPEYVESQQNAARMSKYLEASIGDSKPTPDDLHAAFAALKRRNLLEVRVLPREPRTTVTDQDLYDMPLDELLDLALSESRQPGGVRRV